MSATSAKVELIGFDEFLRFLAGLPEEVQAEARAIVREETLGAAQEIEQAYPERTYGSPKNRGTLKRRVKVEFPSSQVAVGIVRSQAPHADLYEFGTAQRRTKTGANRGSGSPHPVTVPIARRRREQMAARLREMVARKGFEVSGE